MLRTQQMAGRPHRLHQTRGACGSGRTAARSNLLESQSASGIYVPLCLLAFPWYELWFLLCQFLSGFFLVSFWFLSGFFPVLSALRLFWRFVHQSRAVHALELRARWCFCGLPVFPRVGFTTSTVRRQRASAQFVFSLAHRIVAEVPSRFRHPEIPRNRGRNGPIRPAIINPEFY